MIRIRGKGVTYGEVWFDEEPQAPLPDILICRQRSQPRSDGRNQEFMTLLIDLTQEASTLLDAFGKENRYKVRRAQSQDEVAFTFIDEPAAELDVFSEFYDQFAATKGLAPINRQWLRAAAGAGSFCLTHAAQAGDIRVWHAYVVSSGRARLIYSASLFRGATPALQAAIGRINAWLHWQDMLEFKRRGYHVYDFGGLFSDESSRDAAGINRFKQQFGGARARNFDCTLGLTWKGRLYLTLLGWRGQRQSGGPPA